MKHWFPFTDYDFYGYLACGLALLFSIDYWHSGGYYLIHKDWSFFQGALTVSLAYVTGQIISMLSSLLLEHGLARTLLRPPTVVLLSGFQPLFEFWLARLVIGRYYAPLPSGMCAKIFENAEKQTGLSHAQLKANVEEILMSALHVARTVEDTRRRMDDFRNQYGFNRNMSLSGFIATGLLFHCAWHGDTDAFSWGVLSLLLSLGMLARFLKFYSCFAAEVLRTYAFQKVD